MAEIQHNRDSGVGRTMLVAKGSWNGKMKRRKAIPKRSANILYPMETRMSLWQKQMAVNKMIMLLERTAISMVEKEYCNIVKIPPK